jgi:hypothetical protein
MSLITGLIGMIILGILSAVLSYYHKNYYVRLFDDILGREEDEAPATRAGRGFFYGFFFPVYFNLVLWGLLALIAFLVAAGIIAAIAFVLVWFTEKILPKQWVGGGLINVFSQVGLHEPPSAPVQEPGPVQKVEPPAPPAPPVTSEPPAASAPTDKPSDEPPKA